MPEEPEMHQLHEAPCAAPAPPELVQQAAALVRTFPECFWFWHSEARITTLPDVRLVIEHLRSYGGHSAWRAAQQLHKCLLPFYKKTY